MPYSIHEITLGGLLHDVGKLIQRAHGSLDQLDWKTYDMAATLCPIGKYQNYTHQHVLFTNAFFDLMQQFRLSFPHPVDFEKVSRIASFHHRPDASPDQSAAWICALADRYSAGMDRKDSEEETSGNSTKKDAYRHMPLRCIFDEVILDSKRGEPKRNGYPLRSIAPYDTKAMLPLVWQNHDPDLPEKYLKLWSDFWPLFQNLTLTHGITVNLFIEALLGLLEKYTWAIPSSTIDLPDISLYDHLRTTAAISACIFSYHQQLGNVDDLSAVKNDTQPKFRFFAGDLSGLQKTLFTLESQGVKGVSKILRARSFMLSAIAESAALQTVEAFGLTVCNVVQQAGGRFLILVPAVLNCEKILHQLRERFDKWLLEKYSGTLSLNLTLSKPFPPKAFTKGYFSKVFNELTNEIEKTKLQPLMTCHQGVIPQEFPYERACNTCGVRPAQTVKNNEHRCRTCQQEVELGQLLTSTNLMIWTHKGMDRRSAFDVLGLDLILSKQANPQHPLVEIVSLRNIRPENENSLWALRLFANHIPRFRDEQELQDKRYSKIDDQLGEPFQGLTKTFAHLAAEALELKEDGTFAGKPFLAIFKADVDHLGAVFSIGLKRKDDLQDRFTLSRMAQLSRMMDLFFTGYLQGFIKRDFSDTYTVYAGGDDLLLIGPWRQMLRLAAAIQESFNAYTGGNRNITISAGLSLLAPSHPINRAVNDAEKMLDSAKESDPLNKNKICVFEENRPISWNEYRASLENAEWVHDQMQGKGGVSTGFVYRILKISDDVEAVARGDVKKAGWLARLAYHLARNIKGINEAERTKRQVEWLQRLGFDRSLDMTNRQADLCSWRLPLSIALYRNRQ